MGRRIPFRTARKRWESTAERNFWTMALRLPMWCRDCKKEIRPKVAGAASVQCPGCGRIITASVAPRSADAIRQAREILERWQSTDLFDQINATGTLTSLAS